MLDYLCSADLSKGFSQMTVSILIFSLYFSIDFVPWKKFFLIDCVNIYLFSIFFNSFCPVEKCGVTPHCLYNDSLSLRRRYNLGRVPIFYVKVKQYFSNIDVKIVADDKRFWKTIRSELLNVKL